MRKRKKMRIKDEEILVELKNRLVLLNAETAAIKLAIAAFSFAARAQGPNGRGQEIEILLRHSDSPMRSADVSRAIGITNDYASILLSQLCRMGRILRVQRGRYAGLPMEPT